MARGDGKDIVLDDPAIKLEGCGNVRNVLGNVSNVSPRTVNVYLVCTLRVRHSHGSDVAVGSAARDSALV